MRSRELADLAGVTVRTLRHYHQIGLLPEPERTRNGYRNYTAAALVRILRARNLVELGVALSDIPAILDDDSTEPVATTLDRIEADIATKIARLDAQRELVRSLRALGSAADAPPLLGGELARLHTAARLSPDQRRLDLDLATIIEHNAPHDAQAARDVLATMGLNADSSFPEALTELSAMPSDAAETERQRIADDIRASLKVASGSSVLPITGSGLKAALAEVQAQYLNSAQLDTIKRL